MNAPALLVVALFGPALHARPIPPAGDEWLFETLETIRPIEISGFGNTLDLRDLDGDGYTDFASTGHGGSSRGGAVYVFSGFDRRLMSRFASQERVGFGTSLARQRVAGGATHLVISDTFRHHGVGEVRIVDPLANREVSVLSAPPGFYAFGREVASGTDTTGDKIDEVAVIAEVGTGAIFLFDGASGQELWRFKGVLGERLSGPADFLDDVDGDGVMDVLVGSSFFSGRRGRVLILSGSTGKLLWSRRGINQADAFGWRVRTIDDIDRDGKREFAFIEQRSGLSRLHIHDGATQSLLHEVDLSGDLFNASGLELISDRNCDGIGDLILFGLKPGFHRSRVSVLSGRDGSNSWLMDALDLSGTEVRGADELCDLNGDGLPDLVITHRGVNGQVELLQTRSLSEAELPPSFPGSDHLLHLRCPSLPSGNYALLFSTSIGEGVSYGTRTLPLAWTPLFRYSAFHPTYGSFDAKGEATVTLQHPPIPDNPMFRGLAVFACFVGLDPSATLNVRAISNAYRLPLR